MRYRWRCQNGGCVVSSPLSHSPHVLTWQKLHTYSDNKEVARCGHRYLTAGYFNDQTRWTLHIFNPEELTLDMGVLLMTFLWMDHPRLVAEFGTTWCPLLREPESTDSLDLKTVREEHRMLAKAAKHS